MGLMAMAVVMELLQLVRREHESLTRAEAASRDDGVVRRSNPKVTFGNAAKY